MKRPSLEPAVLLKARDETVVEWGKRRKEKKACKLSSGEARVTQLQHTHTDTFLHMNTHTLHTQKKEIHLKMNEVYAQEVLF